MAGSADGMKEEKFAEAQSPSKIGTGEGKLGCKKWQGSALKESEKHGEILWKSELPP